DGARRGGGRSRRCARRRPRRALDRLALRRSRLADLRPGDGRRVGGDGATGLPSPEGCTDDVGPRGAGRSAVPGRRGRRRMAVGARRLSDGYRSRLRAHGLAVARRSRRPARQHSARRRPLTMAATTDAQSERTRELISAVPPGRVTTYGAVAEAVGLSTPRTVAWILRTDGGGVPWQRVVRADGRPA